MEARGLARAAGPAAFAGIASATFPDIPAIVGVPLMAAVAGVTAWGFRDSIVEAVPALRRFRPSRIPLRDVVRRAALHTEWALNYEPTPQWREDLSRQIIAPLADGRAIATGLYDEPDAAPATAPTAIPPAFWSRAAIDVRYHLVSNDATMAYGAGSIPVPVCTEVTLDSRDVGRLWPIVSSHRRKGRAPALAKRARDWYEDQLIAWITHQGEQGQHPAFYGAFDALARQQALASAREKPPAG